MQDLHTRAWPRRGPGKRRSSLSLVLSHGTGGDGRYSGQRAPEWSINREPRGTALTSEASHSCWNKRTSRVWSRSHDHGPALARTRGRSP